VDIQNIDTGRQARLIPSSTIEPLANRELNSACSLALVSMKKRLPTRSMIQTLPGKVALVTGGAKGIGRATALKLASAGCDIAINYYNSHSEATSLCDQIQDLGRKAIAIQGNVADHESIKEIFSIFTGTFHHLDILVSNAASGVLKPVMQMNRKHFRWCLETNALALVLLCQEAIQLMNKGGSIIALSSIGASRAIPDYGFIGASKAAQESLVRSLAQELGQQGIRINTVSAGAVDTSALSHFQNRDLLLEAFMLRNPTGKSMVPEHIANVIYLLSLPEAEMINGQILVVDGGYAISG
jgi:enoyl-[acyl-carrier protein] reductase III